MQNIAKTRNNPGLHQKLVLSSCPAGSGQEVSGEAGDFPCISGISRLIICLGRGIIKLWFLKPSISNTVKGQKICRT